MKCVDLTTVNGILALVTSPGAIPSEGTYRSIRYKKTTSSKSGNIKEQFVSEAIVNLRLNTTALLVRKRFAQHVFSV
jgi:hypothetical protein